MTSLLAIILSFATLSPGSIGDPDDPRILIARPDFIDLALVYAFLNFIGVVAVLRLFEHRGFGADPSEEDS